MDSDFRGGSLGRKSKTIQPIDQPAKPAIHELAAKEGFDIKSNDGAGPEASAAETFVPDKSGMDADDAANQKPGSDKIEEVNLDNTSPAGSDKSQEPTKFAKWSWLKRELSHKQKFAALLVGCSFVVLAGLGAMAFNIINNSFVPPVAYKSVKPKPQPIYSPLTGEPVSAAQAKMPITGVMIENSLDARPQSGLSSAGIVYEAIAEAGITRFLALYQYESPTMVGPVRSARPYFVRWAQGYHAGYAHVGGSPEALQDIKNRNVHDLDQFFAGGNVYSRIGSRAAPHNMYTSLNKLRQLEKDRNYGFVSFTGFDRKADTAKNKLQPSATSINMNISSASYAVRYAYNQKANNYQRYLAGQKHIDANGNKQITPKVVVALIVPFSLESDHYHSNYDNIGSGQAFIFQDGQEIQGTWQKASIDGPLKLVDSKAQQIKLNRGQVWITALKSASELKVK